MGLYENMKNEQVRSLDCRSPVLVSPNQSVRQVVSAMRDGKLGCAILVDQHQKPRGVFTESMLIRMLASNPAAIDELATDHVAKEWHQVKLSDPIVNAVNALVLGNTRFLIVVDEQGCVASITGQKGLMEYIADHYPGQVAVQRIGQKPYMHQREGA